MPGSKANYNTTRHFFSTVMFVAIVAVLGAFLARISIICRGGIPCGSSKDDGYRLQRAQGAAFFSGFLGGGMIHIAVSVTPISRRSSSGPLNFGGSG